MPLPADNCGCSKLHAGVRRLEFADSDGAHISYELCGIANWRSRRGSKTHKDEKRLPEAASLSLSNRSNFLTIGGFSFAICTTKPSVSASTLGRPGERRNLDPSNLLAISWRYQPRMVSGLAVAATSSSLAFSNRSIFLTIRASDTAVRLIGIYLTTGPLLHRAERENV